jgi:hypothetical protein
MNEPKPVGFKNSSYPRMIGELLHSNQFLKVFSLSALLVVFMVLGVILVMATKEPVVITLGPDGKAIERMTVLPKAEDQIEAGIRRYLEKRYQWEPENVAKKLKEAEEFITPSSVKAFRGSVFNVAKFSTDKIVSQKVFPNEIKINLANGTALITGDRVTSIQGLKAAGNLKLELSFESGPRTQNNPWGIYISKEREE